jgi:hypothetical protein
LSFTTANTQSFIHKEQYGKKKKKAEKAYKKVMSKLNSSTKFKKMPKLKLKQRRKK